MKRRTYVLFSSNKSIKICKKLLTKQPLNNKKKTDQLSVNLKKQYEKIHNKKPAQVSKELYAGQ